MGLGFRRVFQPTFGQCLQVVFAALLDLAYTLAEHLLPGLAGHGCGLQGFVADPDIDTFASGVGLLEFVNGTTRRADPDGLAVSLALGWVAVARQIDQAPGHRFIDHQLATGLAEVAG
ncbi:hypothetical protein D3C79_974560 [compost metagenome]